MLVCGQGDVMHAGKCVKMMVCIVRGCVSEGWYVC
jgi:hypothetical protein